MNREKWFESKGMNVLKYQQNALADIEASMDKREITVLAATPTAGKTAMSINVIEEFLENKSDAKILALTHGTSVLRTQYYDDIDDIYRNNKKNPMEAPFEYKLINTFSDYDPNRSVNITLPQTISSHLDDLGEVDLLIVDESHERYFAKELQSIIKKIKPKKQLLLTGSPDPFILKEMPIIAISLLEVYDEGRVSEIRGELASSCYDFIGDDYNNDGEIKENSQNKFTEEATISTMEKFLDKVFIRMKSVYGGKVINFIPNWLQVFKKLGKTMIACKTLDQAGYIENYLKERNVNCVKSTYDTDVDSEEIKNFKDDPNILVLIVIYRGILGFNFPELRNIIDLTASDNVRRIWQLLCRLARPHPDGGEKFFFKLVPQMLTDHHQIRFMGVCALADKKWFTFFNGKNFNKFKVVEKKYKKKNNTNNNDDNNTIRITRKTIPVDFLGLPIFGYIKTYYHKKGKLVQPYVWTTLEEINKEFGERYPPAYWTMEKCIESALQYTNRIEWKSNDSCAYHSALNNGHYHECVKHMKLLVRPIGYWTKEKCIESALKHKTRKEWINSDEASAHIVARNNDWLDECTTHMELLQKPSGYWDVKENVLEDALNFNTISDWHANSGGSYGKARENGWYNECITHMEFKQKPSGYWTKEKCMESALKYKTLKKWLKNESPAVNGARRYGKNFYKSCIIHMKRTIIWTPELCKEEALKYKSRSEWQRNNNSSHKAANRFGCFDECCKYMDYIQKPNGYWTKEKCLVEALKHKTKSDWNESCGGSYQAAKIYEWFKECTAHMPKHKKHRKIWWTIESCLEKAKSYPTYTEWYKNEKACYLFASRRKWLDIIKKYFNNLDDDIIGVPVPV